jgi:hypothetical protein
MNATRLRTRIIWAGALALGIITWSLVTGGPAYAPPGSAPVSIVDGQDASLKANVDADGSLQVSGEVSVGGSSSVEVSNFPETQEVSGTVALAASVPAEIATEVRNIDLIGAGLISETFTAINARFISISSEDEVALRFATPDHTINEPAIRIGNNRQPTQTISLPLAIPLDKVALVCENEVNDCLVLITIVGT